MRLFTIRIMEMDININKPDHDSPNHTTNEINSLKTEPSVVMNFQLMNLLEDELKDIYWSEKIIAKNLSKMIERATSHVLIEALEIHLEEKEVHIKRVENAFELIEKDPVEKKCKAIASLIEENEEIVALCASGTTCDTAIISAGKKVEEYEIGIYRTLHRFAENLGLKDVAKILKKTLNEEIAIDNKF